MGAITDEVLEILSDLTFRPYRLLYGSIPTDIARVKVRVAVKRLEKRGLIEKGKVENEICIRLTNLGKKYLGQIKQKKLEKSILDFNKVNGKWDGVWRVVVFDIPEENRRIRNALRLGLKMLEFKQLQKSVWISKIDCMVELRSYVRELGLKNYVLIFETKDLGIVV